MTMNLLPREVKLIELLCALPPRAAEEVADFAAFKASRTGLELRRSCLVAAAWERAATDPAFASEVQAIQSEFAVADGDGLSEDY